MPSDKLPVIGLSCDVYDGPMEGQPRRAVECLPLSYSRRVAAVGGLPILLPNLDLGTRMEELLEVVDGVLFTGAGDIDPVHYGEKPWAKMRIVPERDRFELSLLRIAVECGVPVLGICRGIQLVNVGLGGSLHQDMPGHDRVDQGRQRLHTVSVEVGSALRHILGKDSLIVNTSHHQAIKEVAPGLRAVAWAEDGMVEAVEGRGRSFLIGIQWHPEIMNDESSNALFRSLIKAAEVRQWARKSS